MEIRLVPSSSVFYILYTVHFYSCCCYYHACQPQERLQHSNLESNHSPPHNICRNFTVELPYEHTSLTAYTLAIAGKKPQTLKVPHIAYASTPNTTPTPTVKYKPLNQLVSSLLYNSSPNHKIFHQQQRSLFSSGSGGTLPVNELVVRPVVLVHVCVFGGRVRLEQTAEAFICAEEVITR